MDLSQLIPQLGIGAIFIWVAYKLYIDMRQDSLRREEQIRTDSKEREEKLFQNLNEVTDTLKHINNTMEHINGSMENINNRLIKVEQHVCIPKEGAA